MPKKADRRKKLVNPDNHSQGVELGVVDNVSLKHGTGFLYKVEKMSFLNDAPNERKVHTKTVTHKAKDVNGNPTGGTDDPNQKIEMEVIDSFVIKTGSGPTFQRREYLLLNKDDDESKDRKTHTVRIHGKDNSGNDISDVWLDVRRSDEPSFKTGSGSNFQRFFLKLNWDDDAFNASTADAPLDTDPDDGFDPPWRLDPFQEVVNVSWSSPTQAGFSMTWTYRFEVTSDTHVGEFCPSPDTVVPSDPDGIPGIWDPSTSTTYSFPLAHPPVFSSSTSDITQSNTTVTGEPVPPPETFLPATLGVDFNPGAEVINIEAESYEAPMQKGDLAGPSFCYYRFGPEVPDEGRLGVIATLVRFTALFTASGITATLLGKASDRSTVHILNNIGNITIIAGFSWDIPAGFDLSSGNPLP